MNQLLNVEKWLNLEQNSLTANLQGKTLLVYAFQMLCPGCVQYTIPQAKKVNQLFSNEDFQVVGLHSVFEHHQAMTETCLTAFLHEYQIKFPVAIDKASDKGSIPVTMLRYQMQGTPTLLLFNHSGDLRLQKFGQVEDLELGYSICSVLKEKG